MFSTTKNKISRRGVSSIIVILMSLAITIFIVGSFTFVVSREVSSVRSVKNSTAALAAAESGIDEVITRIRAGGTPPSPLTLAVGAGSVTVTTVVNGNQRTITAVGTTGDITRTLEVVIAMNTTDADFIYGVQVGDGGLTMANNSTINGSVYSDGDIIGGVQDSRITGDAIVAIGVSPTPDQQWTAQNTDFPSGTVLGSIVTTVDSSADVGQYGSLVLGADGFARISYYDNSNKDLKFARCTNADCSAKNVTTVDSSGDVGYRYTAIAVGSDGFARISYFDNTGNDLKFAQCTNADCTTKSVSTVDAASAGEYSSMALGADGFARISYYDGDLKFARCLNAACSSANIRELDSAGDTGKYTSLALGADGFARISYIDETNDDLKFIQCTDDDCTTPVAITVDSGGLINLNTSVAIGADGFARISYFDDSNDNVKFARCTNADCSAKNTTTVDSVGDVGRYNSIALGADGFARISYYDGTNGAVKYAQCADVDCSASNISTPDSAGAGGDYTFIRVSSSDNFARIIFYDIDNGDLRFIKCGSAACSPPDFSVDLAQSFVPAATQRVVKADIYLKKVGSPANATVRIVTNNSGVPSTTSIAGGTLNASQVTGSYGWLTVSFSTTPSLTAGTPYWLLIDAVSDASNYLVWGGDSPGGYASGAGQKSADWSQGNWSAVGGDLDFKVYMGGTDHQLYSVDVDGNASAHTIDSADIGGNANAFTLVDTNVGGNVVADSISGCAIGGNASYNTKTDCTVGGTQTTPTTPPDDPPHVALPISAATLTQWKTEAANGGTCIQPQCDAQGNLNVSDTLSLGPKKITGNVTFSTNATLNITGNIWVAGSVTFANGCIVQLDSGYGANSGVLLSDGMINVANTCTFQGSGQPGSFVMLLTDKVDPNNTVLSVGNTSTGVIYYATDGRIDFSNNASAQEATGYGMTLAQGVTINYTAGLANSQFSSGPSGGWSIISWKEL